MKLIDEKEYKKTLRELMETPFGGYQQKPIIKQHDPEHKVINEQPTVTQTTPVYATPQPQIHITKEPQVQPVIIKEQQPQPSSLSLYKTGTAQLSLTRLGVLIGVGGAMFGYLYATSSTIQLETNTLLSELSAFTSNPIMVGSIVLGVLICTLGLIFKR